MLVNVNLTEVRLLSQDFFDNAENGEFILFYVIPGKAVELLCGWHMQKVPAEFRLSPSIRTY